VFTKTQIYKNMHKGLNENGYLWVSGYPVVKTEVGPKHPDHLEEAFIMREDVLEFLKINFKRVQIESGFLFNKK